jgi:hypothetical protein
VAASRASLRDTGPRHHAQGGAARVTTQPEVLGRLTLLTVEHEERRLRDALLHHLD